ncbi:MAG: DUF1127 domain-containing protein [Acetobacteraceae bacterium]|nr:DUF1127 domain-containing protein [Acetobacteraceae bacterium]
MDTNARSAPAATLHRTRHGVAASPATDQVARLGTLEPAPPSAGGALDGAPGACAVTLTGPRAPAARSDRPAPFEDAAPRPADVRSAASRLRVRALRVALRRAVRRLGRLMRTWRRRQAESDALRAMSDRELRDMNVSRYDVADAVRRPFWRS